MASEPARFAARAAALAAAAVLALAPVPAHALKVATWNVLAYQNPGEGSNTGPYIAGRQGNFRTVMAALDCDVLLCEEMNSASAADSFRLNVLGNVAPGVWSGTWASVGGNEGMGIFYKSAKVAVSNVTSIGTGGPRNAFVCLVKPVGYLRNGAWFRIYGIHFKAGNTSTDATTRATEASSLRTTMNNTSTSIVGPNILLLGDSNIYYSTELAYQYLTQSQASNTGRMFDYLALSDPWHSNGSNSAWYTQCPCLTCTTTGQSGGGLDDRFDLALTSSTVQDGAGLDYVTGSYTPFGNDGQHFNTDINGPPANTAVSAAVANALHDVADHIPVVITLQLPAKASIAPALALGDALVGGSPTAGFAVANGATAPAAALKYSLAASTGFSAPPDTFTAAAGAAANVHAIGMDTGAAGVKSGTLTLASNDNDSTAKVVQLSGRVLAHAVPSLDSLVAVTAGALDFGARAAGAFADSGVRVMNAGWNDLQGALAVTGGTITGNPRFSLAGGFTPATLAGTGATWNVHFDDTGAGGDSTYTASLTFTTADAPLPGATALAPVTVALSARVTGANTGVPGGAWTLRFLAPRPNPLHDRAEVGFELPAAAPVSLGVYDLGGRRIATLAEGIAAAGRHALRWEARTADGSPVPAGVYFVRFVTPGLARTARIAVLP